jgi:histidinol-phosphate aminotransferase
LSGITPYPSEANFILVRVPEGRAASIHAGMRAQGVLVKRLDGAHPLLRDCLRLTVGTDRENRACLDALEAEI